MRRKENAVGGWQCESNGIQVGAGLSIKIAIGAGEFEDVGAAVGEGVGDFLGASDGVGALGEGFAEARGVGGFAPGDGVAPGAVAVDGDGDGAGAGGVEGLHGSVTGDW